MSTRSTIAEPIREGTTAKLAATILDEDGEGFKPETLTLFLYDEATNTVLNDRDRVNVLDTNGGAVSAEGALTFELTPDDNAVVTRRSIRRERHVALFEFTWASGDKSGAHEVAFTVEDTVNAPTNEDDE